MPVSIAITRTPFAARYLAQLCKHFQHRRPVVLEERHGQITFDAGTCDLEAEGDTLIMRVSAPDESALHQLEDVVARHLARFAFREPPEITWRSA